jgi:cytochrome bd-type quinol oxidase subunit 1
MEFQFGTNWARFSRSAGGVIGQTLAMEGVFSFFLESSFLGLFIYVEKRLNPLMHWLSAFLIHNAAAAEYGLWIGLWWWIPGMALAGFYSFFVYRRFAGKVESESL